jgi:hypothetical protein
MRSLVYMARHGKEKVVNSDRDDFPDAYTLHVSINHRS